MSRYDTNKLIADLNLPDVARALGIRVLHGGKTRCPFHDDKDPSMVLYQNRYKCFLCGTGRTIDFIQKVGNMSFYDACDWAIKSFGLDRSQYVSEEKRQKPIRNSNSRTFNHVPKELLDSIGLKNNPFKVGSAVLPVDAYKEVNYKGFVGYVERNFKKYLPSEYTKYGVQITTNIPEGVKDDRYEVISLVIPNTKTPQLYIRNIYDQISYSRNISKVFSFYARAYIEALKNKKDMVEEYREHSVFNYHIEREDNSCVRYEASTQNPLQELFETNKSAYEFLVMSKAGEKLNRINKTLIKCESIGLEAMKKELEKQKVECLKARQVLLAMSDRKYAR